MDMQMLGGQRGVAVAGQTPPRSDLMEPGGIEPPSRDSPLIASTRIVGALISVGQPPPTAFAFPSPSVF